MDGPRYRTTVGVDIVNVEAFKRANEYTRGALADYVFTTAEIHAARGRPHSLAARWAAKEAVAKALGVGLLKGVGFRDIEIDATANRVPTLRLHRNAEALSDAQGWTHWSLSLSHEASIAVAVASAIGAPK